MILVEGIPYKTLSEAANELGMSETALRGLIESGQLPRPKFVRNQSRNFAGFSSEYLKAARTTLASPDRRKLWSYGQLLDWHLINGTRPDGRPGAHGRLWSSKEFANAVGFTAAAVNNWRRGRFLPVTPHVIEAALFGNSQLYEAVREELRSAYSRARSGLGYFPTGDSDQPLSVSREGLAEVASPAPSLLPDGRLDAGPNVTFDVPVVNDDLSTLPLRQASVIETILVDLPGNAPKHLRSSLNNYRDELKVRGTQPVLGLLKDMAAIIAASVGAEYAQREWLEDGMREAFARFEANHDLFVQHFPLDAQREDLYFRIYVDESAATGAALSQPFEEVARATTKANEARLTTDDFLKIVDKMAEFAKVVSTQPPPFSDSSTHQSNREILGGSDATAAGDRKVSLKKRILLSGFGFIERSYNLLGSTATLLSPEGVNLLHAFKNALSSLSRLIGF